MKRKIVIEIICFLFIVLFLYTGVNKLIEYRSFTEQIKQSPLLSFGARYIALVIPFIEILTAISLTVLRFRYIGIWVSSGLMFVFTIYVALILVFSEKLPCSCGGVLQALNWRAHLVFNVFFLTLAVIGVILERREQKMLSSARMQSVAAGN